jgi:hypothetical protein
LINDFGCAFSVIEFRSLRLGESPINRIVKCACIPLSVESLGPWAFHAWLKLRAVGFEAASHLARIGQYALLNCQSLFLFWIPPEVSRLDVFSLHVSPLLPGRTVISISKDNQNFKVCGDFVTTFSGDSFIWHFGKNPKVRLTGSVAHVADGCFYGHAHMKFSLTFEPDCRPLSFGCYALYECLLSSIRLPSSVEVLRDNCFRRSQNLWTVTFEPGSHLARIERCVFGECRNPSSICIPSSVEVIGENSFHECAGLSMVTFEAGSHLARIEKRGFAECSSLSSICLPSSVEVIGENCFHECCKLLAVTFDEGSHLARFEKRVFAECSTLSSICLPSSVEVIGENCFLNRCFRLSIIRLRTLQYETKMPFLSSHALPWVSAFRLYHIRPCPNDHQSTNTLEIGDLFLTRCFRLSSHSLLLSSLNPEPG